MPCCKFNVKCHVTLLPFPIPLPIQSMLRSTREYTWETCLKGSTVYSGNVHYLAPCRALSRHFLIITFQCQETTPTNSFACEIPVRGSLSQFKFLRLLSALEKREIFSLYGILTVSTVDRLSLFRLSEIRPPRYIGHLVCHELLARCLLHKTHPEMRLLAIPYTRQYWLLQTRL